MEIHRKFGTWLASANITPNDETLRRWWAGLDSFVATASEVVSLVQLAKEADASTVADSNFYIALRKQDAALLPSQKVAVAALASAKLHCLIEIDSAVSNLAALLTAIAFPIFENQPKYRADLAELAEKTLGASSRNRADLGNLIDGLDDNAKLEAGGIERIMAVTAEEINILWWVFGGRSRDSNDAFADIASEAIPFVAAKELADLTNILPGHIAVPALADRVCREGRAKAPESLSISSAVKKLSEPFVNGVSTRWANHACGPICRVTQVVVASKQANGPAAGAGGWSKAHKMHTTDLSKLFYRECLVLRAWKKASA